MGTNIRLQETGWVALADTLQMERKRQKLSREQAAAVCGVSISFIRDAESHPELCSLGKLVCLINGLGLSLSLTGLSQHHAEEQLTADYRVPEQDIVTRFNPYSESGAES